MNGPPARRRFLVAQIGARMHYAVPRILAAQGLLERLHTDLCATVGLGRLAADMPPGLLPAALARLAGRAAHDIDPALIRCSEAAGLAGFVRRARARTRTERTEAELAGGSRFARLVARAGFGAATDFYGFSGECLEAAEAARSGGLRVAVEQIIAPRAMLDAIMREEEERFGSWIAPEADAAAAAFAAREKAEWAAADLVLCGSSFVRDGVVASGGDPAACVVVPYGVDTPRSVDRTRRPRAAGPLRVLTVGALGLRKGTPHVLAAADRLRGKAEFVMAVPAPGHSAAALSAVASAVRWVGPVPRAEIPALLASADVFLLPSLCEGSATAIYEALAAGLPVVCTPNAGSVVSDGEDGFIVPIRDPAAIAAALERLADDPDRLEAMSRAARRKAAEYDIAAYGRRLLAALGVAIEKEEPRTAGNAA